MANVAAICFCFITSATLRIILPYNIILGSSFIRFVSPDSYYHAMMVRQAAGSLPVPFYDQILYVSTNIFSFEMPVAIMVLPMLVHFATLVVVFLIGKRLWGDVAGIISILFLAVMPGEYLGRTILGELDYHGTEVFLTTFIAYLVIIAFTTKNRIGKFSCLAGILFLFTIYYFIWNAQQRIGLIPISHGLLFGLILFAFGWLTLYVKHSRAGKYKLFLFGILGIVLMLGLRVFPYMVQAFNLSTWATTQEALPIFIQPYPLPTIMSCLVVVAGLFVTLKQYRKQPTIPLLFLIVWSSFMLLYTILQRRFGYYLAVNSSLLCAYMVVYFTSRYKKKIIPYAVAIILCATMIPVSVQNTKIPSAMPDDWHDALVWIKENTPQDATITAWWDYGYWIEYEAQRKSSCNNSQDPKKIRKVAKIFTADNIMEMAEAEYLLLDQATLFNKYGAVEFWGGRIPIDPVVMKLWQGMGAPSFCLVYESDNVKLYKASIPITLE